MTDDSQMKDCNLVRYECSWNNLVGWPWVCWVHLEKFWETLLGSLAGFDGILLLVERVVECMSHIGILIKENIQKTGCHLRSSVHQDYNGLAKDSSSWNFAREDTFCGWTSIFIYSCNDRLNRPSLYINFLKEMRNKVTDNTRNMHTGSQECGVLWEMKM